MASALMTLIRGFPGKPSHPPLTDVAIGAYTVGVAMLVLGVLGVEEEQMAHGALLAIGGGPAVSLPTALTGMLDWLQIEKGTPRRTIATVHLVTMLLATVAFAATFVTHLDGYDDGSVEGYVAALGLLAEALLTAGGYLGGTLVFVYGVRALGRRDAPVGDALIPWRGSDGDDSRARIDRPRSPTDPPPATTGRPETPQEARRRIWGGGS
jgi:uncharacterized membrane protein